MKDRYTFIYIEGIHPAILDRQTTVEIPLSNHEAVQYFLDRVNSQVENTEKMKERLENIDKETVQNMQKAFGILGTGMNNLSKEKKKAK
jgi:hypothetical protein